MDNSRPAGITKGGAGPILTNIYSESEVEIERFLKNNTTKQNTQGSNLEDEHNSIDTYVEEPQTREYALALYYCIRVKVETTKLPCLL